MEINLESLGLTQEQLAERLIESLSDRAMSDLGYDDGEFTSSDFARRLHKMVQDRIDAKVMEIAEKHVLPHVGDYIENVVLQKTNQWGEAKGSAVSFRQYLIDRAEAYLTEQVNYDGKPKGDDSYSWRAHQTRIAHMIDKHLHYHIETAMKDALRNVNSAIAEGLQKTVKLKLEEALNSMKVSVKTSR